MWRTRHPLLGLSVVDKGPPASPLGLCTRVCTHAHICVCTCMSAHAHVCPGLPFTQSGSSSGFVCCSLVASTGVQMENHSCASRHQGLGHQLVMSSAWARKLHVDRGASRGHTSSTGTQALHGHTSSAWTENSTWTHDLHEDTRAPRDMSPSSTRLPLPLHLPGMPPPCSNMLSAGGPPDTWRRQAHGMGWGGHCTQQTRTSATCHRLVTSRTDPERRCRAQRVGR